MQENSVSWKIIHSSWILLSFIPFFSGLGFFWIGTRADEKKWLHEGLIYEIPFILILLIFQINYTASFVLFCIAIIAWFISIIRAFYVRNEYLNYLRIINSTNNPGDNRWEFIHSLWILLSLIPFFNGSSFFWIGSRADEKKWLYEGLIYEIPFLIFMPLTQTNLYKIGAAILLIGWFINIFRAFYVRNEYLDCLREQKILNKTFETKWEIIHSLWIIPSFIIFLNGIGLIWIGFDTKNRKWFYEGIIYQASVFILLFISTKTSFEICFYIYLLIWIISIFRSFYLRKDYLNSLKTQVEPENESNNTVKKLDLDTSNLNIENTNENKDNTSNIDSDNVKDTKEIKEDETNTRRLDL